MPGLATAVESVDQPKPGRRGRRRGARDRRCPTRSDRSGAARRRPRPGRRRDARRDGRAGIDGADPARPIAAAMAACDVFIAPDSRSLGHTPARKPASESRGARRDHAGRHRGDARTGDRGDSSRWCQRSRAVGALLGLRPTQARVALPAGTDVTLKLGGRAGSPTTACWRARGVGQPARRRGFASRTRTGTGTNRRPQASAGGSAPRSPRGTRWRMGSLVAARARAAGPELLAELRQPTASSAPTSPSSASAPTSRAMLTGKIFEDEGTLTAPVHLAFGASAGMRGCVSVPIRLDVVVIDATLGNRRPARARRRPLPCSRRTRNARGPP